MAYLPSLGLLVFATLLVSISTQNLPLSCDSPIYCYGNLLKTVQMNQVFPDSKTFVDKSLDPILNITVAETLARFDAFMVQYSNNPTKEQVRGFVDTYFVDGNELIDWDLPAANPAFLSSVSDPAIRDFATQLVAIWSKLGKKIKPDVEARPERYSLIPVPNGFIIPGGRFKEFYYWDSYFILEGLLVSEMADTAKGMIDNFLYMVDKYGFVPNGGRRYYLNRSQPPFLTLMASLYMQYTNNWQWLNSNVHLLEEELNFWVKNRAVTVYKNFFRHTMYRYNAASLGPRPESYFEDVQTASTISDPTLKQNMYTYLKSAAESGWDFSTRWFFDASGHVDTDLRHINTPRVVPVDLNSLLAKSFKVLSKMLFQTGNFWGSLIWSIRSIQLSLAIDVVMWNDQDSIWYDYDLDLGIQRKNFYVSNLMPLFTDVAFPKPNLSARIIEYLKKAGIPLSYPGGVPASILNSGQQWDLPNAWPPHQQIIVEALENLHTPEASALAKSLAISWVEANEMGFAEKKAMFEKYDAIKKGKYGGGGEYQVQEGFGWTNGVALTFVKKYFTN